MKNILFTSYGYNDKDVSESFTSYCLTKQIDGHYDYTVYTKDAYVGKNVVNIKTVPFFQKLGYYRALKWDYFEFILKAYSQAKKDINNYDLIHHISPISFRYHNPLSKLDKPFIWGPVGGSLPYPKGFERIENKDSLVCKLRKMDTFRLKHDPILNSTMRRSERIVVTCRDAKRLIPEHYQEKTVIIPEGINIEPETSSNELDENYIFSSGRLVPYKALDLLIESFSKIKNQTIELWITGKGREAENLKRIAAESNVGSRVKILGAVSKQENIELLRRSKLCVFPALNEAFGHINLEAMSMKKAIIVARHGGPADIVEDGISGYTIPVESEQAFIQQLTVKMDQLLQDEQHRKALGMNGFHRVKEYFSWDVIGKQYLSLYDEILA